MKKSVLFLISALSLGAIVGCSTGEGDTPVQVLTVTIEEPAKKELTVGESIKLVAKTTNNPNALSVSFESSNVSVARVDFNGNVTAVGVGTCEIVAKVGETKSNKITFTVKEKDIVITIKDIASKTLKVNDEITLEATVLNNKHNLPLVWESSVPTVASIDASGKVKALKKGETTIVAKVGDFKSEGLKLTVENLPIGVVIDEVASTTITEGDEVNLKATVTNNIDNLPLTWNSSNDTIASIDETGKLTALKEGETTVTAKVGDVTSAGIKFTINKKIVAVESVAISAAKTTLDIGETITITSTVLPEDATNKEVTLSTESTKVIIDGMNVTARKATVGDEVVTIKATSDNNKTATLDLKINTVYQSKVPAIKERINASKAIEATDLSSGTITYVKTGKTNLVEQESKTEFSVFNDNATFIRETNGTDVKETSKILLDNGLATVIEKIDNSSEPSTSSLDWHSGIKEFGTGSSDLKKETAENLVKLVDFNNTDDYSKAGVGYYIINNYFDKYDIFGSEPDSKGDFTYNEINANTVEVKAHVVTYSNHFYHTLKLEFYESGMIKGYTMTTDKYESDYDTEQQGAFIEKEVTTCTTNVAPRVASTGKVYDLEKLYISSYDIICDTTSYNPTAKTSFLVGDSINVIPTNVNPETYSEDFDGIDIISISNTDVAEIVTNKWTGSQTVKCKAPCDDLTITVQSRRNKVKKETHVKITPVVLEKFTVSGLSDNVFLGYDQKISVSGTPYNASIKLSATLIENTCGATLKQGTDYSGNVDPKKFVVTPKTVGTYTIKIVEETLGEDKAYIKKVTVHDSSDQALAEYAGTGTYDITSSGTYSYTITNLKLAYTGGTSGTMSLEIDGGVIEGTYTVLNKEMSFVVSKNTTKTPLKDIKLSFYSTYSGEFSKLTFMYNDDGWDGPYRAQFTRK